MTEDKMAGWHHWLSGHEFAQAPGDGDGQGGPAFCSPWGRKELDMTEWTTTAKKPNRTFYSQHYPNIVLKITKELLKVPSKNMKYKQLKEDLTE